MEKLGGHMSMLRHSSGPVACEQSKGAWHHWEDQSHWIIQKKIWDVEAWRGGMVRFFALSYRHPTLAWPMSPATRGVTPPSWEWFLSSCNDMLMTWIPYFIWSDKRRKIKRNCNLWIIIAKTSMTTNWEKRHYS